MQFDVQTTTQKPCYIQCCYDNWLQPSGKPEFILYLLVLKRLNKPDQTAILWAWRDSNPHFTVFEAVSSASWDTRPYQFHHSGECGIMIRLLWLIIIPQCAYLIKPSNANTIFQHRSDLNEVGMLNLNNILRSFVLNVILAPISKNILSHNQTTLQPLGIDEGLIRSSSPLSTTWMFLMLGSCRFT